MSNLRGIFSIAPVGGVDAGEGDHRFAIFRWYHSLFFSSSSPSPCHGFWHNAALVVPSALFIAYLGFQAKWNVKKLRHGRSYVMIAYYVLLWFAAVLNLAWSSFQVWQCAPGKDVAWNLLSLSTASVLLCLEISVVAFFLQDNYVSGLETLAHTFMVSGVIVGVDVLLKVTLICFSSNNSFQYIFYIGISIHFLPCDR